MKKKDYQKNYHRTYEDKRNRVSISLNDTDFLTLSKLATQESLKPTTYAKLLLQNTLNNQNPNKSQALQEELRQTKLLIRNIATNVNQIAHRSNTLRVMVDEQDLLLHLKKLEDTINNYVSNKTK